MQYKGKREVGNAEQKVYDELYEMLDTTCWTDVQQDQVIQERDGNVLTSEEDVLRRLSTLRC